MDGCVGAMDALCERWSWNCVRVVLIALSPQVSLIHISNVSASSVSAVLIHSALHSVAVLLSESWFTSIAH